MDLPDEMILKLCENMNVQTLSTFTRSNWRMYNICNEIFQDKLGRELAEKYHLYAFFKDLDDINSHIYIDPVYKGDKLKLQQYNFGKINDPWPIPNIIPELGSDSDTDWLEITFDYKDLPSILRTLEKNGYIMTII